MLFCRSVSAIALLPCLMQKSKYINDNIAFWLLYSLVISSYRALDPLVLPTEASQIVKQRLLTFIKSLSAVLAFAYCLSR